MRGAHPKEILNTNATTSFGWAVTSKVVQDEQVSCIDTICDTTVTNPTRKVILDGKTVRPRSLLNYISVIWLAPSMSNLFIEGTTQRRTFVDRMLQGLHPEIAPAFRVLERAVKERFRILQSDQRDLVWVHTLEKQIVEKAIAIVAARKAYCERLSAHCDHLSESFPKFSITVEGMLESWLDTMPALEAEEKYAQFLQASRMKDKEMGGIAYGPHRSNYVVQNLSKNQSAHLCSTGEQKALLISMILAHSRLVRVEQKRPPVVLLDEITAHLDDQRRDSLFEDILNLELQVWMTGTDPENFKALTDKAQFFGIEDGTIKERQHG